MKKVIYVQGIHDMPFKNRKLFKAITTSGFEVIYFPALYSVYSLKKQKELISLIEKFIDDLGKKERVTILAHSFGGILAYSLRTDTYKKVDTIMTVASPHNVGLLNKTKISLGYNPNVKVKKQVTVGMMNDLIVSYKNTRYREGVNHYDIKGGHECMFNNDVCMSRVISEIS